MSKIIRFIVTIVLTSVVAFLGISYLQRRSTSGLEFNNFFTPKDEVDEFVQIYQDPSESFDAQGYYIKIPRIKLLKSVVKDVDPRVKEKYVSSWKDGVSHGRFTAYPNQIGNSYFFGHAVSVESRAEEQNAWFTRLDELELDDFVYVYYEGIEYKYQIISSKPVAPDATGVYTGVAPVQKLTLQTCGPPRGSLDSRVIVDALLIETKNVDTLSKEKIYSFEEVNANDIV